MTELLVNIDGTNIGYSRQGRGSPMLLVHGYPLDRTIWERVATMLEADYDVIMPDLRGFGSSDVMEADRSITGYASDLAGLLERLKIRRAHIVGHSMGGYAALAFARQFPEKTAGLGLVASQVLADSEERKASRQASAREIMDQGVASVAEAMVTKLSPDKAVQDAVRAIILRQRTLGLSVALDAMAGRPDSSDVLRAFSAPAVLIHGDADELIPVERGREMKNLLPAARYLELAGGGHMPMMENPAAVAEALRLLGPTRSGGVTLFGT